MVCPWEKAEMILLTLASALVQFWLLRGQLQQMMMSLSSLGQLWVRPLVEVIWDHRPLDRLLIWPRLQTREPQPLRRRP